GIVNTKGEGSFVNESPAGIGAGPGEGQRAFTCFREATGGIDSGGGGAENGASAAATDEGNGGFRGVTDARIGDNDAEQLAIGEAGRIQVHHGGGGRARAAAPADFNIRSSDVTAAACRYGDAGHAVACGGEEGCGN